MRTKIINVHWSLNHRTKHVVLNPERTGKILTVSDEAMKGFKLCFTDREACTEMIRNETCREEAGRKPCQEMRAEGMGT